MALVEAAMDVLAPARVVLAHVHHGLLAQADDWLEHCRATAARHAIAFRYRRLDGAAKRTSFDGLGLEGWARRERYGALADIARECGARAVMTAHHLQDQIETVRLRAARGAGARGLAGICAARPIDAGDPVLVLRPFIDIEPARLAALLEAKRVGWIEDPSNADPLRARTAVRRVLEREIASDPGAFPAHRIHLAGARCAWVAEQARAVADLESCRPGGAVQCPADVLSRARLSALPHARQAAALRQWLADAGTLMPSRATLQALRLQLVESGSSQARVRIAGRWIVRHRDRIAAMQTLPVALDAGSGSEPLPPISVERLLIVIVHDGDGLRARARAVDDDATPRHEVWQRAARGARQRSDPRAGQHTEQHTEQRFDDAGRPPPLKLVLDRCRASDRLRLSPGAPSRSWKNLCQEAGIPAWLRPCLPALRDARSGRLRYAAPFGVLAGEDGVRGGARAGGDGELRVLWTCPAEWRVWLPHAGPAGSPPPAGRSL